MRCENFAQSTFYTFFGWLRWGMPLPCPSWVGRKIRCCPTSNRCRPPRSWPTMPTCWWWWWNPTANIWQQLGQSKRGKPKIEVIITPAGDITIYCMHIYIYVSHHMCLQIYANSICLYAGTDWIYRDMMRHVDFKYWSIVILFILIYWWDLQWISKGPWVCMVCPIAQAYQKELFQNHSVKLVDVDWDTPPKMKGYKETRAIGI